MRKLLIGLLFTSLFVFAHTRVDAEETNLGPIGRLDHAFDDELIATYIYDKARGVVCVSVTAIATRRKKSGSVATSKKCYKSNEKPHFKVENLGYHIPELSESLIWNKITVFKIIDETNDKACYGTLTSMSGKNSNISVEMDCL